VKFETNLGYSCTSTVNNIFEVSDTHFPFLKNDDPVYFAGSFGTVTANQIYYIVDLTAPAAGVMTFRLADIPSWSGTPVKRTWTAPVIVSALVPNRLCFLTQTPGISGLPAGLATLTTAQANRSTGDIRYYYLELCKMLRRIWEATAAGDRPKRVRTDSHDFIADPSLATRNYTFELDLTYTTTAVANEPAV
jgi:hypothetical protein